MKKNTYSFRDVNNILGNFDKGFRSQFIRESLERNIKQYSEVYNEELAVNYELIDFYKQQDEKYSRELEELDKSVQKVKKLQQNNFVKLNKKLVQNRQLMNILNLNGKLKENNDLEKNRKNVCEKAVHLIMLSKHDKSAEINIEYLVDKGKFISKEEMKNYLNRYVDEKLEEGRKITKTLIRKADIHYIKKKINEM